MTAIDTIRQATAGDRAAIRAVEELAFGQTGEADLVEQLVADSDAVLELVAVSRQSVVGHILFSRLHVDGEGGRWRAVALAPVAVHPDHQARGIGLALIGEGHRLLKERGETLSVVLGDPAYYRRAGYQHARAAGFDSDYQCDALQALAWGEAPVTGKLVYAAAFRGL